MYIFFSTAYFESWSVRRMVLKLHRIIHNSFEKKKVYTQENDNSLTIDKTKEKKTRTILTHGCRSHEPWSLAATEILVEWSWDKNSIPIHLRKQKYLTYTNCNSDNVRLFDVCFSSIVWFDRVAFGCQHAYWMDSFCCSIVFSLFCMPCIGKRRGQMNIWRNLLLMCVSVIFDCHGQKYLLFFFLFICPADLFLFSSEVRTGTIRILIVEHVMNPSYMQKMNTIEQKKRRQLQNGTGDSTGIFFHLLFVWHIPSGQERERKNSSSMQWYNFFEKFFNSRLTIYFLLVCQTFFCCCCSFFRNSSCCSFFRTFCLGRCSFVCTQ